ncbi:MAG TPA: hypothetical protein VIF57_22125 [Polyangia bacterium]|jgi:hypothetical protein
MAALSWLALVMAAAGVAPAGAPPVRLAPVTCPGIPDADVRAALRVELRDRLVRETAPAPPDFALVSVACHGDEADLLADLIPNNMTMQITNQSSGASVSLSFANTDGGGANGPSEKSRGVTFLTNQGCN